VEAVVVSFMNAYANPTNERAAAEFLAKHLTNVRVIAASFLSREYREFERTSTAVVSAYVHPLIENYLGSLTDRVEKRGYKGSIWVVQSNGGRMALDVAREHSVATILSGPAAGVVAGQRIAATAGFGNIVTMDMGGTSLDLGVVIDGEVSMTPEMNLEFGISVRLPMIDVHTLGAGGGSIAWIDHEGLLAIGPQSAGAVPGPACYGRGGELPTLTDANVVLGRIGQAQGLGSDGSVTIDRALACRALERLSVAVPGKAEDIAEAIVAVATRRIAEAVRLVTVERGLRPSDFTLVTFGGAGALHACAVMRDVGFERSLIPRFPGLTSALGCILGDIRHDFVQTVDQLVARLSISELRSIVDRHRKRAHHLLAREGVSETEGFVSIEADMSYDRQTHTVSVSLGQELPDAQGILAAFEQTYQRRFGRLFSHADVILVSLKTTVVASRGNYSIRGEEVVVGERILSDTDLPRAATGREVYFEGAVTRCPVVARNWLTAGSTLMGPAIIEQSDATCVLEPGFCATVDTEHNIVVTVVH
jgi:N-methylhydantoinase A